MTNHSSPVKETDLLARLRDFVAAESKRWVNCGTGELERLEVSPAGKLAQEAVEAIESAKGHDGYRDGEMAAYVGRSKGSAPEGRIWVCGACGKTTRDKYGEDRGWDESCMLNAVLCYEHKRFDEKGILCWVPFPQAPTVTRPDGGGDQ